MYFYTSSLILSLRPPRVAVPISPAQASFLTSLGIFKKTQRGSRGKRGQKPLILCNNQCPWTSNTPVTNTRQIAEVTNKWPCAWKNSSVNSPSVTEIPRAPTLNTKKTIIPLVCPIRSILCNARSIRNKTATVADLIYLRILPLLQRLG